MFWPVVAGISCIKILLIPTYHSTDFEVHRNWLAITHSLPIGKWYYEDTSEWTLDYPPLFAWFEYLLAKVAWHFDPQMLRVNNLSYASELTVMFQRLSVIVSDLVYAYGCKICSEEVGRASGRTTEVTYQLFIILFGNAGLLLVDHIHFQYNGFLYGILFISIARMMQRREIEAALWFSVLLNLKHIYLYVAPAYFIYLLRSYCLSSTSEGKVKWNTFSVTRLLMLGTTVLAVFGVSFGPFIYMGQLTQVLSRLFPFKRGLSHAYWAPNFWALYNFADKVLEMLGSKFGLLSKSEASMTGGLVQEFDHAVLPSISPLMTLVATVLSIIPSLFHLWKNPHSPWHFVRGLVLCSFGSYMFGWHVHEKAVLLIILPLGLLCMQRKIEAQLFVLMSIVGHFSLFPLIFTNHETSIKVLSLLLHALITTHTLQSHWNQGKASRFPRIHLCNGLETFYLLGLIPLFMYYEFGHQAFGLAEKLPFLPLMLVSVYCAIGIFYSWLSYYCLVLSSQKKSKKKVH